MCAVSPGAIRWVDIVEYKFEDHLDKVVVTVDGVDGADKLPPGMKYLLNVIVLTKILGKESFSHQQCQHQHKESCFFSLRFRAGHV